MEEKKKQIVDLACRLLPKKFRFEALQAAKMTILAGDGSQRTFIRLQGDNGQQLVAVLPGIEDESHMAESRSAWLIGSHLYRAGVPVPEPMAYDEGSGTILFEDLGDLRLHDYLDTLSTGDNAERIRVYCEVVRELARMQVLGSREFQESWCWQTPRYDRELMLSRESGYFISALCQGLLGLGPAPGSLSGEFQAIADNAATAPVHFFLHRDFQSRNLMLKDGRVRIIDFQGGRLGPLAYDLASLLIDPYVGLNAEMQDLLLDEYLQQLNRYTAYDPAQFRQEYFYLALQRNLQILGAFSFLGGQQGKGFFLPYIRPALKSLHTRLAQEGQGQYPVLSQLVQTCQEQVEHHGF